MAIHRTACAGGFGSQLQGVFLAEQRLCNGIARQNGGCGRVGIAQHQNGAVDPLSAQLQRLLHGGDAEPVGALFLQPCGNGARPVSVAVRLNNGKVTAALRQKAANAVIIV